MTSHPIRSRPKIDTSGRSSLFGAAFLLLVLIQLESVGTLTCSFRLVPE